MPIDLQDAPSLVLDEQQVALRILIDAEGRVQAGFDCRQVDRVASAAGYQHQALGVSERTHGQDRNDAQVNGVLHFCSSKSLNDKWRGTLIFTNSI